jgi:hypothetical protein
VRSYLEGETSSITALPSVQSLQLYLAAITSLRHHEFQNTKLKMIECLQLLNNVVTSHQLRIMVLTLLGQLYYMTDKYASKKMFITAKALSDKIECLSWSTMLDRLIRSKYFS